MCTGKQGFSTGGKHGAHKVVLWALASGAQYDKQKKYKSVN